MLLVCTLTICPPAGCRSVEFGSLWFSLVDKMPRCGFCLHALKSPHIVGLFCPYSGSLLTLVWSAHAHHLPSYPHRERERERERERGRERGSLCEYIHLHICIFAPPGTKKKILCTIIIIIIVTIWCTGNGKCDIPRIPGNAYSRSFLPL